MNKFLSILSTLLFVIVSSNSFADALSILSKTPATMLDIGVIKLEKRLNEIAESSRYPKTFQTPTVRVSLTGKEPRPRGIEIQGSSYLKTFKTEEDAIDGCKNWLSFMRNRAGYNTETQKFILDSDDSTDDRHSFFVLHFDSQSHNSNYGISEIIEDSFRLYCSANYTEPKFEFVVRRSGL